MNECDLPIASLKSFSSYFVPKMPVINTPKLSNSFFCHLIHIIICSNYKDR